MWSNWLIHRFPLANTFEDFDVRIKTECHHGSDHSCDEPVIGQGKAGTAAPRRRGERIRVIGAVLGAALAMPCVMAWAQAKPQSGHYDSFTLAVNGNRVSGVFSEERGDPRPGGGPQFSCIFLLEGTLDGSSAKVDTWAPDGKEHIPGTLTFAADGGASLKLADDHGGCGMTVGTMSREPYSMTREKESAQDWTGAALVSSKRAVLRAQPAETTKRTPYIVQYDPVAVIERKNDWVRVRYYGEKGAVNGWLPVSELAIAAGK